MKRLSFAGLLGPAALLLASVAGCTSVADGATFAEQFSTFVTDSFRQVLAAYLT